MSSSKSTRSKSSTATLKQGKLSFVSSKRTAAAKETQKPKVGQSKSPSVALIVPSEETSENEVPSRDEIKTAPPAVKSVTDEDGEVEPKPPLAELNEKDPKYRKLHAAARAKMDHLSPIHAEGQNKIHEILRIWDMSPEYGPFVGVTRLERWERAESLGLNPPVEVRDILLTRQGTSESQYSESVLYGEV